ncbi:hypothetical protein NECAME_00037 [Necator americanus]|uniref:Uncharacterized protein n=1 Tax=Necator americanus TaxID=51031 RepID=W2TZ99_NECAM|nr:hypothetical protein NECAME_00037 [Necator americanus]ETN87178.1 hypothetical protein NECAME_00037 [Necator americanus]
MRVLLVVLGLSSVACGIEDNPWIVQKTTDPQLFEKVFEPMKQGRFVRQADHEWMTNTIAKKFVISKNAKAMEERSEEWMQCFKPYEQNVRHYKLEDGWHKLLTCKSTTPTDYVVLAANKNGNPITIGAGSASRMIRCNDRGKWVAKTDKGKEVEVKNAFCYVVPKYSES